VLPKPEAAFVRGPQTLFDSTLGWRMVNPRMEELYPTVSLGQTAENVAAAYEISRQDQDAWALRSHERAIAAQERCLLSEEIVPVEVPIRRGETRTVGSDEGPRRDTSLERLASLKPAFVANGTVTAGNSSQINDGAAAVLLASEVAVRRHDWHPLVRFVDAASAGVDPAYMGIGPVPATRKLLRRVNLSPRDMEVVELNEAFASQVLAVIRELGLDPDRVNVNGGAIAIGHPLGASGARLAGTLARQMARAEARYGLATMCIGVGQGISALFERAP
jgi:acetyl-CoA C-acetyltransferase